MNAQLVNAAATPNWTWKPDAPVTDGRDAGPRDDREPHVATAGAASAEHRGRVTMDRTER